MAIRDSDQNAFVRITDESDYTDGTDEYRKHLSESRMNRITRITQMNAKGIVLKNPWNPKIRGNP